MKEIYKNLYIGNDADCAHCTHNVNFTTEAKNQKFAIVHACKTCHQNALHYTKSLPATHPNYLIYQNGNNLFLNLVDMPMEFCPKFTHPVFDTAIKFIHNKIQNGPVLIHCNQGRSRSTSLGLVYLARIGIISDKSYAVAANEFIKLYPEFYPGNGVMLYTKNNWDYLMRITL